VLNQWAIFEEHRKEFDKSLEKAILGELVHEFAYGDGKARKTKGIMNFIGGVSNEGKEYFWQAQRQDHSKT
jgi:hypothetical protein